MVPGAPCTTLYWVTDGFLLLNRHRVYTRSVDEEERELATRLEAAAVAATAEVVTLSRADADFIAEELAPPGRSLEPKVLARQRAAEAVSNPHAARPLACAYGCDLYVRSAHFAQW